MDLLETFDTTNSTTEVDEARSLLDRIEAYRTGDVISSVIYSISDGAGGTSSVGNAGFQRTTSVYPTLADANALTNPIVVGTALGNAIVTSTVSTIASSANASTNIIKRRKVEYVTEIEYDTSVNAVSAKAQRDYEIQSLVEELRRIIDPDNCLGHWHGYTRVYPG